MMATDDTTEFDDWSTEDLITEVLRVRKINASNGVKFRAVQHRARELRAENQAQTWMITAMQVADDVIDGATP